MSKVTVGSLLRQYKEQEGISLRELEQKCKGVFSYSSLSEIANGSWLPTKKKLLDFCTNLGLNHSQWLAAWMQEKAQKR